jgi:hypothetical protein
VLVCAGPSEAFPSQIKACAFKGFWRTGSAGIGVLFIADKSYWKIQDSGFVNCKHGVYYNSLSHLTVTGNYFTK